MNRTFEDDNTTSNNNAEQGNSESSTIIISKLGHDKKDTSKGMYNTNSDRELTIDSEIEDRSSNPHQTEIREASEEEQDSSSNTRIFTKSGTLKNSTSDAKADFDKIEPITF